MIGAHVICDVATLAKGPEGRPVPGTRTLFLGATGWTSHRPTAMQFKFAEDAQVYVDDCKRRHPAMMAGRQVAVIAHTMEGEQQPPQGRGRVITDNDPFSDKALGE